MARTLHKYRVWFATADGERFFIDVEGMNTDSAMNKARTTLTEDPHIMSIGGRKREWNISFVQQMDETGIEQHVTIIRPGSIPPITKVTKDKVV